MSQYQLAQAVDVPARRINEIVHGQRRISADTALRLARYFGTSERFWINLQARYDLEVEKGPARRGTRRHPAPERRGLTPTRNISLTSHLPIIATSATSISSFQPELAVQGAGMSRLDETHAGESG